MAKSADFFFTAKEDILQARKSGEHGKVFSSIKKEYESLKHEDKKKEANARIGFLKQFLHDDVFTSIRTSLLHLLSTELRKIPAVSYELVYDSFGEGLEPIYYWILDFMRDASPGGLGLDVKKGLEEYEASVTSGYFGEMGQRATLMQQKSMEYLGAVNQLIKSILNLIYDLKEFELRIEEFDKLKDTDPKRRIEASHALKGVWMDTVDARKGRGSINMLAQDLNFITLRDAFFFVEDPNSVSKLDLNDRVKNILTRKFEEYRTWTNKSEIEIKNRYIVERTYLRSQVGTLRLYANWIKPYLRAAQKLKMKEFKTPDLVNAFSTMELKLDLYGKREVKPASVHESFAKVKLSNKYYALVDVSMDFRSVPSAVTVSGQRQYVHGGRVNMVFAAYAFDQIDLEAFESQELYEDLELLMQFGGGRLVEDWVEGSLAQLHADLEKYLTSPGELKSKPAELRKPLKSVSERFTDFKEPFAGAIMGFKELFPFAFKKGSRFSFVEIDLKKTAEAQAKSLCTTTYNIYKKTHGMLNV
ncbi:hypothetical protein HZB00_03640 [Candidatus Woesearchaeota archaeon]|nr:hypothetical protein [Candidatus Woesearchaeota archaeon]